MRYKFLQFGNLIITGTPTETLIEASLPALITDGDYLLTLTAANIQHDDDDDDGDSNLGDEYDLTISAVESPGLRSTLVCSTVSVTMTQAGAFALFRGIALCPPDTVVTGGGFTIPIRASQPAIGAEGWQCASLSSGACIAMCCAVQ